MAGTAKSTILDSRTPYSDEKIFIDPTTKLEKLTIAGNDNSTPIEKGKEVEKEVAMSDAPQAIVGDAGGKGKEVVVANAPDALPASSAQEPVEEKVLVAAESKSQAQTREKKVPLHTSQSGPSDTSPRTTEDVLNRYAPEKQIANPNLTTDDVPSPTDQPPSYTSPTTPSAPNRTLSSTLFPASQKSRSYREYSYYHVAPWRPTHNTIVDPEGCAKYFVEVSEFSKGKQDVSFHDVRSSSANLAVKKDNLGVEEGKGCKVVGFAGFVHGKTGDVRLAVGDAEGEGGMGGVRWIMMRREGGEEKKKKRGKEGEREVWGMLLGPKGEERRFEWRGSGADASIDESAVPESPASEVTSPVSPTTQLAPGQMQLVDVERGEVVAMYTELRIGRSLKKRGKMRMYEDAVARAVETEPEVEMLAMLSIAALNEKRRRKTWKKWALMGAG